MALSNAASLKRVKIGPVTYRVSEHKELSERTTDGISYFYGRISYNKQRIKLWHCAPDMQLVALWHEILHGIFQDRHFEQREDTVDGLAYALIALIRDNPELIQVTAHEP